MKQFELLALINIFLTPPDQNLSISFFANLRRTTKTTSSTFSYLYWKDVRQLYFRKHYLDTSIFIFYILVSCFHNSSFHFFVWIPQLLSLKNQSFLLIFSDLCLKDFSHSNSSKVLIWLKGFYVAFLVKPCNCEFSSTFFLLSFFHRAISIFCHLVSLCS